MCAFQQLSTHALYERTPLSEADVAGLQLSNAWQFIGIDMAPNASLESGMAMVDSKLTLLRSDKLYTNAALSQTLGSLPGKPQTIVVLDMPKNLSVPGRFRQEELKYHALRLHEAGYERASIDRYNRRARQLYTELEGLGFLPILAHSTNMKVNLGFYSPFKARSPQGCRALQGFVSDVLQLGNVPSHLIPSSVLDAMILAYAGWVLTHGDYGKDASLYKDSEGFRFLQLNTLLEKESSPVRPDWVPC